MVSTPERLTDNSTIYPTTPTTVKKPSTRKSLCLFINILYVKNKTVIRQVGADKSKRNATKVGNTPWESKQTNTKINDQIKEPFYNWIMHHPQVVQSTIFNDCLNVNIDGHTRPKIYL